MNAKTAPVVITGRAAVCVTKYTSFDISNPGKTKAHEFTFLDPKYVKDGALTPDWSKDGYRLVGWAEIKVEVLPAEDMLGAAVESLKAEKRRVIADAQAAATRIEAEIQKLLSITHQP
jgi:hypothetical protein